MFFPLHNKEKPKLDEFRNSIIGKCENKWEEKYANGLYDYALGLQMDREDKVSKIHIETSFSLLNCFSTSFAINIKRILSFRMNLFDFLKDCGKESKFNIVNYFFNYRDKTPVNNLPYESEKYGVYIDEYTENYLKTLNAYYNRQYKDVLNLCITIENLLKRIDRNNYDKLMLLQGRTFLKIGKIKEAKIFYDKLYSHPVFKKEAKEVLHG